MSQVLEKWNEKWKKQRVGLIFENFSDEAKDFFRESVIEDGYTVEHEHEYSDEGYYSSYEVILKRNDYHHTLGIEYDGRSFSLDGESIDYILDISYDEVENIDTFLSKFGFVEMIFEYIKEQVDDGINERKKSLGAQIVDVIERDNNFVFVLSDGREITEIGIKPAISNY